MAIFLAWCHVDVSRKDVRFLERGECLDQRVEVCVAFWGVFSMETGLLGVNGADRVCVVRCDNGAALKVRKCVTNGGGDGVWGVFREDACAV